LITCKGTHNRIDKIMRIEIPPRMRNGNYIRTATRLLLLVFCTVLMSHVNATNDEQKKCKQTSYDQSVQLYYRLPPRIRDIITTYLSPYRLVSPSDHEIWSPCLSHGLFAHTTYGANTVTIWNMATGAHYGTYTDPSVSWVSAVALSMTPLSASWLATGGSNGTLTLWSRPAPGTALLSGRRWTKHAQCSEVTILRHERGWLFSAGMNDPRVNQWRIADGSWVQQICFGTTNSTLTSMSLTPNVLYLTAEGPDESLRLCYYTQRRMKQSYFGSTGVTCCTSTASGSFLFLAVRPQNIIWGYQATEHYHFTGHAVPIDFLAATEYTLVSGDLSGWVKVWDVPTQRCLAVLPTPDGFPVKGCFILAQEVTNQFIMIVGWYGAVEIHDRELLVLQQEDHQPQYQ